MMEIIASKIAAGKAAVHVDDNERFYFKEINKTSDRTDVYGPKLRDIRYNVGDPIIKVSDSTTTDAIFAMKRQYPKERICALNFANYTNPGGGYLHGANAQEENLCADSYLFNVLDRQESFYSWNIDHQNNGLYEDRALYSPGIEFDNGKYVGIADILTCALPNASKGINMIANERVVFNRIKFIKNILAIKKPDIFIAGAWGCGVFGQDPYMIAEDFKEIFGTKSPVKKIIFAVPRSKRNKNYEVFKEVFAK